MSDFATEKTVQSKLRIVYNSLSDIESVDASLRNSGFFDAEFQHLAAIFRKHRVIDIVGICLLHNHNLLRNGEMMVQTREPSAVGDTLVTRPRKLSGRLASRSTPWSFKVELDSLEPELFPIEFTVDALVQEDFARLSKASDFLGEFCDFVVEHSLDRYVGLALYRRAINTPEGDVWFIELSDVVKRLNVLSFARSLDVGLENVIQTVHFMGTEADLEQITMGCIPNQCVKFPGCVTTSVGHSHEPKHTGSKQHIKEV